MAAVQEARLRKTKLFAASAEMFVDILIDDIIALGREARRRNMRPCVRLNGTSDIRWERIKGSNGRTLMESFPSFQFYDYTKIPNRDPIWQNYLLLFSRSENNESQCFIELSNHRNVAVVFRDALPKYWMDYPVLDGDAHDLRFIDEIPHYRTPVIVGLKAKGKAKHDTSGFVTNGR